jgi:ubiquinol-cytochrome c reductase cytochrome b subunit
VVVLHVWALHVAGQNNPLGINVKSGEDTVPFTPHATVKDLLGTAIFLIVFAWIAFLVPNYLQSPDNYIPANPLQTPPDIVPEWYFLPYYAILRSMTFDVLGIPSKLIGVILMFSSILVLFLLPWLDTSRVRSATFRPIYKKVYWLLVIDVLVLGYCGAHPPAGTIVVFGQLGTLYYFLHFLVLIPLIGKIERPRPLPTSIGAAVLGSPAPRAATAAGND